jgi:hypothetical protein
VIAGGIFGPPALPTITADKIITLVYRPQMAICVLGKETI